MFCILITVISINFADRTPECVGSYPTLARCESAIKGVALSVTPETHTGVSFRCVEQGRRS